MTESAMQKTEPMFYCRKLNLSVSMFTVLSKKNINVQEFATIVFVLEVNSTNSTSVSCLGLGWVGVYCNFQAIAKAAFK